MSFQDCPLACRLPSHFLVNFLLKASHAYFSLLYLSWALLANILAIPTHFIMLFFGLPRPIYYPFTSFTLMGFLLNLVGFLSPITTYLLLITTWAYWLLGHPLSLLTHFLGSLGPFSHSLSLIIPMGLLFHSLGFLCPLTPSLPLFIIVGPVGRQSCHSGLLGLLYYFLFSFSSYCWVSSAVGPLVKSGHQHQSKCGSKLSNP